ncbi:MAG: hypothetical protein ACK5XN_03930 [Bacteroidota bacterium]
MKNDIRFFGIIGVVLLVVSVYVLNVIAITEYDNFVGLTSFFLGILFIAYALFLWWQRRQQSHYPIHAAVVQSRNSEQQLTTQSSHSAMNTMPSTTNTLVHPEHVSSRAQLVMALETLIDQCQSGNIDAATYTVQKRALIQHPDAPKRHDNTNRIVLSNDELIDDLLIDYMEGLITSAEYEYRKPRITNQTIQQETHPQ